MNDLEYLRDAWGQPSPPSHAAYSAARASLLERSAHAGYSQKGRGSRRDVGWRRATWLAGGLGLAAATAFAAVLLSGTTPPPRHATAGPTSRHATASPTSQSGQQVLLTAAVSAQAQRAGTYWHFEITEEADPAVPSPETDSNTYETWFARDGRYWTGEVSCPGTVVYEGPGLVGFGVGPSSHGHPAPRPAVTPGPASDSGTGNLTYDKASRLPTDPAALTAWFRAHGMTSSAAAQGLIALEYLVPAPPAVRAAAWRALAAFPDVRDLGPVNGGRGLLISFPAAEGGPIRLVVDPATSVLRSVSDAKGTTTVVAAEWTSHLPRVVPLSAEASCVTAR